MSLADVHFTSWRARLVSTKQPARISARATSHPLNQNGTTTWGHHETSQTRLLSRNTETPKVILSCPSRRWLRISSVVRDLTDGVPAPRLHGNSVEGARESQQ